jgi:hypothetical protein
LSQKLQLQTEKTKSNKSIPKEVKKRVQNQLENQKKKFRINAIKEGLFKIIKVNQSYQNQLFLIKNIDCNQYSMLRDV